MVLLVRGERARARGRKELGVHWRLLGLKLGRRSGGRRVVAVRLLGHLVHRIGGRVNVHRGGGLWAGVSLQSSGPAGTSGCAPPTLTVERSCGYPNKRR